jgi:hypothetical protein
MRDDKREPFFVIKLMIDVAPPPPPLIPPPPPIMIEVFHSFHLLLNSRFNFVLIFSFIT